MTTYSVPDMSCGHCVATIRDAVGAVDARAVLSFDLATRHVTVTASDPALIVRAMGAAGYAAALVV